MSEAEQKIDLSLIDESARKLKRAYAFWIISWVIALLAQVVVFFIPIVKQDCGAKEFLEGLNKELKEQEKIVDVYENGYTTHWLQLTMRGVSAAFEVFEEQEKNFSKQMEEYAAEFPEEYEALGNLIKNDMFSVYNSEFWKDVEDAMVEGIEDTNGFYLSDARKRELTDCYKIYSTNVSLWEYSFPEDEAFGENAITVSRLICVFISLPLVFGFGLLRRNTVKMDEYLVSIYNGTWGVDSPQLFDKSAATSSWVFSSMVLLYVSFIMIFFSGGSYIIASHLAGLAGIIPFLLVLLVLAPKLVHLICLFFDGCFVYQQTNAVLEMNNKYGRLKRVKEDNKKSLEKQ